MTAGRDVGSADTRRREPPAPGGGHGVVQPRTGRAGVEVRRLDSDRSFPRHSHDPFGVGVLTGGWQRSWSGRGMVEAGAGSVITVNPGEMHDGLAVGGVRRAWTMLYLDPAAAGAVLDDLGSRADAIALPVIADDDLAARLLGAARALSVASTDSLPGDEGLVAALGRLFGRYGNRRGPRPDLPAPVARVRQRLDDAPTAPATLAELAALAGLGRFQVLRAFERAFGVSPAAYRLQRRVGLARACLAAGDTPVEAALKAGFADQSHLTRAFSRQFGITPARYRAACR